MKWVAVAAVGLCWLACAQAWQWRANASDVAVTISLVGLPGGPRSVSRRVTVSQGADVHLLCTVSDGREGKYQLNWFLPSAASAEDRLQQRRGKNSFAVILADVSPEDAGDWVCTAEPEEIYHSELDEMLEDGPLARKTVNLAVRPARSECGAAFFRCPKSNLCIGRRFLCDGVVDCPADEGADESPDLCGYDPCAGRLPCENGRCMDPALCCDPDLDHDCKYVPPCCRVLIEYNRRFYQQTDRVRPRRDHFYSTTVYLVIGVALALICLAGIATLLLLRLSLRRPPAASNASSRRNRIPLTVQELEAYLSSLNNATGGGGNNSAGITYNINNGVQFVHALPPSYQAAVGQDSPPPYAAAVAAEPELAREDQVDAEHRVLLPGQGEVIGPDQESVVEDDDNNNNGDINGNSDLVNQNIVAAEEEARQQLLGDEGQRRPQTQPQAPSQPGDDDNVAQR